MLKLTKGVGERVMLLNEETRRPVVVVVLWLSLGNWRREEERIMVRGCGDRRMQLRTEAERGRRDDCGYAPSMGQCFVYEEVYGADRRGFCNYGWKYLAGEGHFGVLVARRRLGSGEM